MAALRPPRLAGEKVTVKVVLAPGATVVAPGAPTVKSPGCEPSLVMASPVRSAVPLFVMVKVAAALVVLTSWLPKSLLPASAMSVPAGCSTAISGTGKPLNAACCSTSPALPFCQPPVTRARARTMPLAGRFRPVNSQPPLMRVPSPSDVQTVPPSVESSKVTRIASGDVPPRSHSTRAPVGTVRDCVAAPLISRARLLRAVPPTVLKLPPMTIFPSACTAMPLTALCELGLKPVSSVPSAFTRAMKLRAVPPTVVKPPPSTIFPSVCTTMQLTWALTFGSKLSSEPSALSRAIRLRVVPPTMVKTPPIRILPSACSATL